MLDLSRRSEIERAIAAALADTIQEHGPITLENRSSAAKRIFGALKTLAKPGPGWIQPRPSPVD